MIQCRRYRLGSGRVFFPALGFVSAVLVLWSTLFLAVPVSLALAQTAVSPKGDFAPGFGLIYGQGTADRGATLYRFGVTSRRMKDGLRIGSLALVAETHQNGVPLVLLDPALNEADVPLTYRSIFAEMKRYFPMGGAFHYYWAVRGGYTRLDGKITDSAGATQSEFTAEQIAPLGILALPLALENPGFLLMAFVDGTSFGLTFDIVPNRIWLDFQVGAGLLPHYRDSQVVLEEKALVTSVLQLAVVF